MMLGPSWPNSSCFTDTTSSPSRTRTGIPSREKDFKSSASAIPPRGLNSLRPSLFSRSRDVAVAVTALVYTMGRVGPLSKLPCLERAFSDDPIRASERELAGLRSACSASPAERELARPSAVLVPQARRPQRCLIACRGRERPHSRSPEPESTRAARRNQRAPR